ncbi:MAG: hypothetical protein ACRD2O_04305 [Terriglobia bacterium]
MVVPSVVEDFRFAQLGATQPSLVVALEGRVTRLEVVTLVGREFAVDSLGKMPSGNLATSLADLDGRGDDEIITRELVEYRGAFTDPIYWYTIFKWERGRMRDVSDKFPRFYQEVALPSLSYLERWFRWAKLNVAPQVVTRFSPLSPDVQLAEIDFVRLNYQHRILGSKDAGLQEALAWAKSSASEIALLGVRSLAEMTAPQAWSEIDKLRSSPNYAVCMEARAAWLSRLHQSFTEADECPRPHAGAR